MRAAEPLREPGLLSNGTRAVAVNRRRRSQVHHGFDAQLSGRVDGGRVGVSPSCEACMPRVPEARDLGVTPSSRLRLRKGIRVVTL